MAFESLCWLTFILITATCICYILNELEILKLAHQELIFVTNSCNVEEVLEQCLCISGKTSWANILDNLLTIHMLFRVAQSTRLKWETGLAVIDQNYHCAECVEFPTPCTKEECVTTSCLFLWQEMKIERIVWFCNKVNENWKDNMKQGLSTCNAPFHIFVVPVIYHGYLLDMSVMVKVKPSFI